MRPCSINMNAPEINASLTLVDTLVLVRSLLLLVYLIENIPAQCINFDYFFDYFSLIGSCNFKLNINTKLKAFLLSTVFSCFSQLRHESPVIIIFLLPLEFEITAKGVQLRKLVLK